MALLRIYHDVITFYIDFQCDSISGVLLNQAPLEINYFKAISRTLKYPGVAESRAPGDRMSGRRHLPDKRVRGTPTGSTPNQPSKRLVRSVGQASSRRKLTYGVADKGGGVQPAVTSWPTSSKPKPKRAVLTASSADGWSEAEEMALTEFLLLYGDGSRWMSTKQVRFWESASKFLLQRCGSKRTSKLTDRYFNMYL